MVKFTAASQPGHKVEVNPKANWLHQNCTSSLILIMVLIESSLKTSHQDELWLSCDFSSRHYFTKQIQIYSWNLRTLYVLFYTSPELLHHESDTAGRVPETLQMRQLSCFHAAGEDTSFQQLLWLRWWDLPDPLSGLWHSGENAARKVGSGKAVYPQRFRCLFECLLRQQTFQKELLILWACLLCLSKTIFHSEFVFSCFIPLLSSQEIDVYIYCIFVIVARGYL